jgi:hypothetical protein
MSELKFATFGCWNQGCKPNSVQQKVVELLKKKEDEYKFLVLLGDNYYSDKINPLELQNPSGGTDPIEIKYNDINLETMKEGFRCLLNINIPKKLILGNHDIEEGVFQSCSNMKSQLRLPWYDIKFPYDFEDHFLLINNEDICKRSYKIVKFIYLDTTIYSLMGKQKQKKEMDKLKGKYPSCYERVLGRTPDQLVVEQEIFIINQLKSLDKKNTNTVIFFGHEPLITHRFKKEGPLDNLKLLDILYELTKGFHEDYKFNYICADFHNFEEAYITKPYGMTDFKPFKIHQLVFGTGGIDKLDDRYNPLKGDRSERINGFRYEMINRYGSDEPILDFSVQPKFLNGYGEIIINSEGLKYNFLSIEPDSNPGKPQKDTGGIPGTRYWENKYLKYKNKYLQHKNNIIYI